MQFLSDLFHDFMSNIFYWVALIIVIVGVVFIINYISKNNAASPDDYSYEIIADEILQEYKDNNIQAELKYEDENVKINGTIDSISGNDDLVEIVLIDSLLGYRVTLTFTDTQEITQIASLVEGDNIVVVGKVAEYEDGILTNNLNIIKCNYEE